MSTKTPIRWNDNSREAKVLQQFFIDGKYKEDTMPKEIYHNHPDLFRQYSEKQFANAVTRIKMKFGWVVKTLKTKNLEEGK